MMIHRLTVFLDTLSWRSVKEWNVMSYINRAEAIYNIYNMYMYITFQWFLLNGGYNNSSTLSNSLTINSF